MHIARPLAGGAIASAHVTTNGAIAIRNLDAQIAGYARHAVEQRSSVADRAALVGLITLREHLLCHIVDYERAADHVVVERRGRRTSIHLAPSGYGCVPGTY